MGQESQ